MLQVLQGKVTAAATLLDGVIGKPEEASATSITSKKGEARRAKYAVWVKNSLTTVLEDLKDWSGVFDMSWFLIIRQSDTTIDHELSPIKASDDPSLSTLKELRKSISSTIDSQPEAEKAPIFVSLDLFGDTPVKLEYSPVELWAGASGTSSFLVDPPNEISTLANVCNLAKRLSIVEPIQFGILRCRGVLRVLPDSTDVNALATRFVFSLPNHLSEPRSLRKLILTDFAAQALDDRFLLATQLAKAVMFVHSAGFVHKNIRPETILILQDDKKELQTVLTGFQNFRLDEGRTLLRGDALWETNLYRHPTRQGVQPEEMYSMQHDIYSLGVCLLEIGISDSLVLYGSNESPTANALLTDKIDAPVKNARKRAFETKRALVGIAEDLLPAKMGRKYTEIVVTCLTCLDKSDNSFGDEAEFLDENGLLVGVRFIEKVSDSF